VFFFFFIKYDDLMVQTHVKLGDKYAIRFTW